MGCRSCGATIDESQRFCSECGTRVGDSPASQSISGNIGVAGGVYQAAGDIHVGGASAEPVAECHVKWSWRSPLTLAVLTWVSVLLGAFGLVAGWQGLLPIVDLPNGGSLKQPSMAWIYVFVGAVLLFVFSVELQGIAKRRTQHLPSVSWLPAVTGWGGRVGIAKLEGACPRDGAALRFYDKPV